MKDWICKHFGHKFNDIQKLMFEIECKASNSADLEPSIECQRCNRIFIKVTVEIPKEGWVGVKGK